MYAFCIREVETLTYKYDIKEITKEQALDMIQKYHYSNTLPKLNKKFMGFYLGDELVGVVTLGYGTQPKNTIQKLFPQLESKDYYEIGRMCMTHDMPRNSESQMLSQLVKWLRANTDIKVLFTWADGMLGKCGYVYQASNFLYAGYCITDTYFMNGVKVHPRSMKQILAPNDKRITVRPTMEQMRTYNIKHYKGLQFKYVIFVDRKMAKELRKTCLFDLDCVHPKDKDLYWKEKDTHTGKWCFSSKPAYITDCRGGING